MALLAGCRDTQPKRCVDENNKVVDPSFCEVEQRNLNNTGYQPRYRYYYGGSGGWIPGSSAYGGGTTPIPGQSYSTTTRGGFGGEGGGGGGGGE